MDGIKDPRIENLSKIIQEYIDAISCINDSFSEVNETLKKRSLKSRISMGNFISNLNVKNEDDLRSKFESKPSYYKRLHSLEKECNRSDQALNILPQSMFISIVSQFDVLIAQLIKFIYESSNKIYEIEGEIQYREVFKIGDIKKIKDNLISHKIDSILRESHSTQIEIIGKLIDAKLDGVKFWSDFIEMTQRRNLFVHCKGVVSSQYIEECKKAGVNVNDTLLKQTLTVDKDYFLNSFRVFYCMGVMLSQVIARKLLENELLEEIDSVLNNIIYETICEKKYDIAIQLSESATAKTTKHANKLDEKYFILNHAQAHKWNGDEKKCKEILDKHDFSETKEDILVAKYALEDDTKNVVESMKVVGNSSKIMTIEAYSTWEIFKEMRGNEEFKRAFEEIFKKPLFDPDITNIAEQTKGIFDLSKIWGKGHFRQ